MNKKGAEFTIGMLIAIVLGVLVLAVIALGFIYGWNNLFGKINVFGGGTNTVSSVSQVCQVSCAQNDKTGFCNSKQTVSGLATTDITDKLKFSVDATVKTKANPPLPLDPSEASITAIKSTTDPAKTDWSVSGITCAQLMTKQIISIDCTNIACA